MKRYTEYILNKGRVLNQEIKNNIYAKNDSLIQVMLVDYVNDTYKYYDARNCPDYKKDETPLEPETTYVTTLITEDGLFSLSTETGFILITEDSVFGELENLLKVFITESGDEYFMSEGDYNQYSFDRNFIKQCLTILTRDLECKI